MDLSVPRVRFTWDKRVKAHPTDPVNQEDRGVQAFGLPFLGQLGSRLPVRILQVVPHYIPAARFGGPQIVAHSLGRQLVRNGHRVTVVTTNLKDETANLDVPVDAPVDIDGVQVFYEPVRLWRHWGFSPMLARRVRGLAEDSDALLVHAHYQFANWIGARTARKLGKPYILFAHGSLHHSNLLHRKRWLKWRYLQAFEDRNLRQAKFVAFNSPDEQSQSYYATFGKVVPSGIETSDFEHLPPAGQFQRAHGLMDRHVFLSLGRLDIAHKGIDILLPAFARLAEERQEVHLVLAGPDERGDEARIRSLIADLGISDRVTLPGLLTGEDKLAALNDAAAFVQPSRFEGMSIALLEALYMRLPALVSDQASLAEQVDNIGAGVMIHPNVQSVYEGLKRLPSKRQVGDVGRQLVARNFTWEASAKLIEDTFAEKHSREAI